MFNFTIISFNFYFRGAKLLRFHHYTKDFRHYFFGPFRPNARTIWSPNRYTAIFLATKIQGVSPVIKNCVSWPENVDSIPDFVDAVSPYHRITVAWSEIDGRGCAVYIFYIIYIIYNIYSIITNYNYLHFLSALTPMWEEGSCYGDTAIRRGSGGITAICLDELFFEGDWTILSPSAQPWRKNGRNKVSFESIRIL